MYEWIFNLWQLLKVCLGFIPAFFMGVAALFLFGIFLVEHTWFGDHQSGYTIFNGNLEDAQSLMSTMMQSMVTMTTLVITVTMMVVALAATQLGPRTIKNFVSNKVTHQYVGYFFCAVLLCALMTGILHNSELADPIPNFTISAVLLYCLFSFFLMLGFINHVAKSCIADHVIFRIYHHLVSSIKRITLDEKKLLKPDLPKSFDKKAVKLAAGRDGFIQNIDYSEILKIAAENDLYIRFSACAGDYVVTRQNLVEILDKNGAEDIEKIKKNILKHVIIGEERTPTQDIEYSFRHLTEIALRALSPGINDHTTAKVALFNITAGLSMLYDLFLPNVVYNDDENVCRIVGAPKYLEHLITPAIQPVLEAGQGSSDMLHHILERLDVLAKGTESKKYQDVIKALIDKCADFIAINFKDMPHLKKDLDKHCKAVQEQFKA